MENEWEASSNETLSLGLDLGVSNSDIASLEIMEQMLERMALHANLVQQSMSGLGSVAYEVNVGGGKGGGSLPGGSLGRRATPAVATQEPQRSLDSSPKEKQQRSSRGREASSPEEDKITPEWKQPGPPSYEQANLWQLGQMQANRRNLSLDQLEILETFEKATGINPNDLSALTTTLSDAGKDLLADIGVPRAAISDITSGVQKFKSSAAIGKAAGALGLKGASRAIPISGQVLAALDIAQGVNTAAQGVGEKYQAQADLGNIQGRGFWGGVSGNLSAWGMGLNPFVSEQEASQIMQTALKAGYSGRDYNEVTGFMMDNLVRANISATESLKMLTTNVEQGGQSLRDLSNDMDILKDSAKNANVGLSEMVAQYNAVSRAAVDAGVVGATAGSAGLVATGMFQDSSILKGQGGEFVTNALSESAIMRGNALAGGIYGDNPSAVYDAISNDGRILFEMQDQWIGDAAREAMRLNAISLGKGNNYFYQMMKNDNPRITRNEADELLRMYTESSDYNYFTEQYDSQVEAALSYESDSTGSEYYYGGTEYYSGESQVQEDVYTGEAGWRQKASMWGMGSESRRATAANWAKNSGQLSQALEGLIYAHDAENIKFLVDGEEQVMSEMDLRRLGTAEFQDKLASGEIQVAVDPEGDGTFGEFRDLGDQFMAGYGIDNANISDPSGSGTHVQIGLTPEAARVLQVENQWTVQANQGTPGHQVNNAPRDPNKGG